MIEIGRTALLLALVFSGFTVLAGFFAGRWQRSDLLVAARRGLLVVLGLVSLAIIALIVLLLRHEYQVRYVYQHVNSSLHPIYTVSALWAGQEGSLLLWLWLLAVFGALLTRQRASWSRPLEPYALAVMALTQFFFAALLCFVNKPFVLLPARAVDGMGLNPLLETAAMLYHPPALFVGYAAYTVPFAYAIAALASGRLDEEWVRGIRRWNLFAWGFLGLGILLGARWAYEELGWGGYWAWDPVENASLVPWLTGTALLHSAMIQERRGLFKVWNLALITGTFLLCILATFVTRSGLVQSVHAFGRSVVGYFFLAFIALMLALSMALVVHRRGQLHSKSRPEEIASREGAFLLTNLLFTGLAAAILLGTLFPVLTRAVSGVPIALDRSFFDRVIRPLGLAILLLLGVCPLFGWRHTRNLRLRLPVLAGAGIGGLVLSVVLGVRQPVAALTFGLMTWVTMSIVDETVRGGLARRKATGERRWTALFRVWGWNRRRYGGYLVHLAVVCLALAMVGEGFFKIERMASVHRGQEVAIGRYAIRYEFLASELLPNKERRVATLGVYSGGERIGTLRPELNLHSNWDQPVAEVAIRSTLLEDLYVSVGQIAADGSAVTLHILLNPFMSWMWIGGLMMLTGTTIAFWPKKSRATVLTVPAASRTAS